MDGLRHAGVLSSPGEKDFVVVVVRYCCLWYSSYKIKQAGELEDQTGIVKSD
jgi:hypothetical protein